MAHRRLDFQAVSKEARSPPCLWLSSKDMYHPHIVSLFFIRLSVTYGKHCVFIVSHGLDTQRNHLSRLMPPPSTNYSFGPQIGVPSAWNTSSSTQAIGYTSAHMQYAAERERWAKTSYSSSILETVDLIAQVQHEIPGKPKGSLVHVSDYCIVCDRNSDKSPESHDWYNWCLRSPQTTGNQRESYGCSASSAKECISRLSIQ
jgi:hypothetical protein